MNRNINIPEVKDHRVIIVGGGFAGIELAKGLRDEPYQVVLLDRNNYFTFQPLLYQVAMGGLEANSVAYPFRRLFREAENIHFRMTEVQAIDAKQQTVTTGIGELTYDYLVIATGSRPRFFGLSPESLLPLKSIPHALDMRNFLLAHFEEALDAPDPAVAESRLNIVVVGGGPTGVELAGALGEMKKHVLPRDYPGLDLSQMEIFLLEGLNRLLPAMSTEASAAAERYLQELDVTIRLQAMVDDYDGQRVYFNDTSIRTRNLIWTAGVTGAVLPGLEETALTDNDRIPVDHYLRAAGLSRVFAIGDVAQLMTDAFPDGHPMLAPVAIQQGKSLATNMKRMAAGQDPLPFRYEDKGAMATVGRNRAVVDLPNLNFQGFFAWFVWMIVHLLSLVGFRNKVVTFVNWMYSYFTYDRALRLIIRKEELVKEAVTEE